MTDDMRTRFVSTAGELLDEDALAALVLADISTDLVVDAARRHPDRVLNVGIREALALGAAAGLALTGLRPIAHSYAPFLVERAFEQIKVGFGHQDARGVLVSVGASYDRAASGRTHHAPGDVALLDTLPGWRVYVPGHPDEVSPALRAAHASPDPAYVRLSTRQNQRPWQPRPDSPLRLVRSGGSALVLAVGPMLDPVLRGTADLDVTVAYANAVRPLDLGGLGELAAASGDTVILVEPYLAGTSTRLVEVALAGRMHRTLSLGVGRTEARIYGTPADHDQYHGLDPAGLRRSIAGLLDG